MATRTWNGTVDANWGTATNWLEVAVPTSADDVVFDVLFPNPCTLNATGRVCKSIDWTNFTSTMTFTNILTVSGNITLGASMTFAGASALVCTAAATLVSNGKTVSVPLTFNANVTYTFSDAWTVSGLLTFTTPAGTYTGQSISASGGVTVSTGTNTTGTTTLTMTGGTWSGIGNLGLSTTLAGNVTVSGTVGYITGTLTYSSGTITTTGSTLSMSGNSQSATLNVNGMTWNNVIIMSLFTLTLTSDLQVGGLLTLSNTTVTTTINGSGGTRTITASGGLTHNNTTGAVVGTALLSLTGGTWSSAITTAGSLRLATTLAGNVTISGLVGIGGSLTYSSGTITTTGSTLEAIAGAPVLDVAAVTWNNVKISGNAVTITLTSNLQVGGLLTLGSGSNVTTIDGSTITTSGGLAHNTTTGQVLGTTLLSLTGGTWTSTVTTGAFRLATTLAGNVTVSGFVAMSGSLTYSSGTITTTGSTLSCQFVACTLNVAAVTWDNVNFISTATHVLSANMTCTGLLTLGNGSATTTINGNTINCGGGLSIIGASGGSVIGTANIVMNGTGTWSSTQTTGAFRLSVTINTAGTVTMSGSIAYRDATLTYTAGTLAHNTSTLEARTAVTLNMNGATLERLTSVQTGTVISLASNVVISKALTITGTAAAPISLVSTVGSTPRTVTLLSTATHDVGYCTATDIDGSAGLSVWNQGGTLTRTKNWVNNTAMHRAVAA